MRVVFDTNVLIDYLNGVPQAKEEIARYKKRYVSIATWMEVLAGARDGAEMDLLRVFLAGFEIVELDRPIAEAAIELRRTHRVRLPDVIIWATARTLDGLLVTRNTRDFPERDPDVRVPYRL